MEEEEIILPMPKSYRWIRMTITVSQVAGVNQSKGNKLYLPLVAYSAMLSVLSGFTMLFEYIRQATGGLFPDTAAMVLSSLIVVATLANVGVSWRNTVYHAQLSSLFREMDNIADDINALGLTVDLDRFFDLSRTGLLLLFMVTMYVLENILYPPDNTLLLLTKLLAFLPLIQKSLTERQFIGLLHVISRYYDAIDLGLKSSEIEKSSLVKIHRSLASICHQLNHIYSLQIFLSIVFIFVIIMVNCETMLPVFVYLYSLDTDNQNMLMLKVFQSLFFMFQVFDLMSSSDRVTRQARLFDWTLYQAMLDDQLPNINKDMLLSHLSMKNEVKFTAYGVFELNYEMITSIMGTLMTLQVMLLLINLRELEGADNSRIREKLNYI
ncbi:hypothetical protein O3M35_005368 [Rhynocoris fuscipes]|uniref:Gustatory receptor n=1 Tax=Rhynocoris fuscipes TaxID=488301 RepID=A0AAW1DNW7_9HEMI